MKKFLKFCLTAFLILCVFLIITNPKPYLSSAFEGLKLWALTVVPSLLPFFFLTATLSQLGLIEGLAKVSNKPFKLLFRLDGVCSFAFFSSVFSGYPIGAKTISTLSQEGYIDGEQTTRASTLCSTSGPLFVLGCVGIGMFNSKKIGYILLVSHLLSAIACGLTFRFFGSYSPKNKFLSQPKKSQNALYDSVYSSVISVALVGGFICVFSVFTQIFYSLNLFLPISFLLSKLFPKELSNAFCFGLIECTRGLKMLSLCELSTYSLSFCSALISFGGVSVWAQSIIFLSKAKANLKIFCLSKILQSVFSFAFCFLICNLLNFSFV